jgi:Retroviral aspartyl protease
MSSAVEVLRFCPDHVDESADGSLKVKNLILSSGVWAPVLSVRTIDEHSAFTADLSIVATVRPGLLPLQASSSFQLPFQSDHSSVSNSFLLSVPQWSETRGDVESVMPRVLKLLANIFRSVLKSWSKNLYKKERTAAVTGKISPQLGNFVFRNAALYCLALTDSDATHSFVSSAYWARNGVKYTRLRSSAALAECSSVRVDGILRHVPLKIGAFRCKQTFLVLDMPAYDVVLGMDFLHDHDPHLRFRHRTMRLQCADGSSVTVSAHQDKPELPSIYSDLTEICSMSLFTRELRSATTEDEWDFDNAVLGCLSPDQPLLRKLMTDMVDDGANVAHPATVLQHENRDVLFLQATAGLLHALDKCKIHPASQHVFLGCIVDVQNCRFLIPCGSSTLLTNNANASVSAVFPLKRCHSLYPIALKRPTNSFGKNICDFLGTGFFAKTFSSCSVLMHSTAVSRSSQKRLCSGSISRLAGVGDISPRRQFVESPCHTLNRTLIFTAAIPHSSK